MRSWGLLGILRRHAAVLHRRQQRSPDPAKSGRIRPLRRLLRRLQPQEHLLDGNPLKLPSPVSADHRCHLPSPQDPILGASEVFKTTCKPPPATSASPTPPHPSPTASSPLFFKKNRAQGRSPDPLGPVHIPTSTKVGSRVEKTPLDPAWSWSSRGGAEQEHAEMQKGKEQSWRAGAEKKESWSIEGMQSSNKEKEQRRPE